MPKPKCVSCNSTSFEHKLVKIEEKPFSFVQCSACGGVVGVLEHESSVDYLRAIFMKLDDFIQGSR